MNTISRMLLVFVLLFCGITVLAQLRPTVKAYVAPIDSIQKRLPIEKLYLQTDKADYATGDTIWFKAYLLNAGLLDASQRSGLVYVELDNSANKTVIRIMCTLTLGLTWGSIALNAKDIPDGSYTLRAYTNWMRNFGEDAVFKKNFYIASPPDVPRLITTAFKETKEPGKDNIQAILQFTGLNKLPVRLQDMQLKVTDGKRNLLTYKASTNLDGKLDFNFALPDKVSAKNLVILAQDVSKNTDEEVQGFTIPVVLNRPENMDLQFMPEGGSFIAGLLTHMAFKAIAEDGKGIDIQGKVYDSKHNAVADVKSLHKGMGTFDMTPQSGEIYTAVINLPNGVIKNFALPLAIPSGTSLKILNNSSDSLQVILNATADLTAKGNSYYLVGQTRGQLCYATLINFNGAAVIKNVAKSIFPSGIARFTLLNAIHQPLNERMVYIDQPDALQMKLTTECLTYAPHDSIAVSIRVTDRDGKPVRGSFSLAVTDDSQVKSDSTAGNILSHMLLTSDLKGMVENPGYYFAHKTPETLLALDNLLLTQGWVGYNWQQIFNKPVNPQFAAEPEFAVKGKVTNIFGKPVAGSGILMISKKPFFLADTVTNADGRFTFKNFMPVDTASFLIQARNKRGKSFNVGIDVDEFIPPVFISNTQATPWYVNSDTVVLRSQYNRVAKRLADEKLLGGKMLKNVTIIDKKLIKDSKNLNGIGMADQVLDEKDRDKAGKQTLLDLLDKIKGYNSYGIWHACIMCKGVPTYYMIKDKKIRFVFDGVDLEWFNQIGEDRYQFLKPYLEYYAAEDIKGIEVLTSAQYTGAYGQQFMMGDDYSTTAFVEITTRGGKGPFMKKTPGIYVYKPLPVTLPKQFYRPKYTVKSTISNQTDLRSTIHWEPNIVTNTSGKAVVSFYSADKPGTYSVVVEGTDLDGLLGWQRGKITIRSNN